MTKKDLFKIILKFYGLYLIIGIIIQLPSIIYYLSLDMSNDINLMMLTVPLVGLIVIYLLLFKPGSIIRLFKLADGFDNDETSKKEIDGKGITNIGLIIIAVYLIASNLGSFVSQVIFSFKESVSRNNLDRLIETFNPNPVNYEVMINSGLCLLIGFLLLTNHVRVSNWVGKINNKNVG